MSNFNKSVFSPVFETENGMFFHLGRTNLRKTEDSFVVENAVPEDFSALVSGLKTFYIDELGTRMYYDVVNNTQVSGATNENLSNYDQYLSLKEQKEELIEEQTKLKFNRKVSKVKDTRVEFDQLSEQSKQLDESRKAYDDEMLSLTAKISDVENKLNESRRQPMIAVFRYVAESNTFYINSTEILDESFSNHVFALGMVTYDNMPKVNLFEKVANNYANYKHLDFVSESKDDDAYYAVLRSGKSAFLFRNMNESNLTTMSKVNAVDAIEYMNENTGNDVSFMFEDILEDARVAKEAADKKIEQLHEMIAFLKDQRNMLADANKNIPEIKEADVLINGEITKLEEEIRVLEAGEVDRDSGYVPGNINRELDGLAKGTEIMVDAIDYTNAGSDDMISVFIGEDIFKVEKRFIDLSSSETV
jgi:predicted nuclease with TOPRIM domain